MNDWKPWSGRIFLLGVDSWCGAARVAHMKKRSKLIAVKIIAEGPWEGISGTINPKDLGEETILVDLDTLILGRDWMFASRDELKLI